MAEGVVQLTALLEQVSVAGCELQVRDDRAVALWQAAGGALRRTVLRALTAARHDTGEGQDDTTLGKTLTLHNIITHGCRLVIASILVFVLQRLFFMTVLHTIKPFIASLCCICSVSRTLSVDGGGSFPYQ